MSGQNPFTTFRFVSRWRGRAAAILLAGIVAVATLPVGAQSTLERIESGGEVTAAIADEAPYGYRDESGRVTGEAPEIARIVLRYINPAVDIAFVSTDFSQLIPGLESREIDIAAAGMFITPSRCAEVAFSNPTYVVGEAFAVKQGNPKNITDYISISENPDARVGLVAGTVEYNYALVAGIPADRAPLYRNFAKAIDAVGLTSLTTREIVAKEPSLESTAQFYPEIDGSVVKGYGGFAFRKEDQHLVEAFNERLAAFIGSPEHLDLVEAFGFRRDMLPDKTAAELCKG
jgi:polar amino acid transport system substrate-binding protein